MVNLEISIILFLIMELLKERCKMFRNIKYAIFITLIILFSGCNSAQKNIEPKVAAVDKNEINLSPYKAEFVNEIANIRAKGTNCGGPADALRANPMLEAAAKAHVKDMATNHFVQHDGSGTATDPARRGMGIGSNFIDRIIFFGYPAKTHDLVGETIAFTKDSLVKSNDIKKHFKRALQIILNDPSHCKILMNPRFKDVGIGTYRTKDGYYWAIEYGEIKK
jgi:uncharacterized protein YkwD